MILRRIEGSRFSEVVPLWRGLTAVVIGGGPSLTLEQIAIVGEKRATSEIRVVAVNDAYLLAPWADVQYAADAYWHRWHAQGVERPGLTATDVRERWAGFAGQKCSIQMDESLEDPSVHILRNRDFPSRGFGLSIDPQCLVTGWNSGFQALNLATLAGATRVILIGFDGQPAADGKEHWFGSHPRSVPAAAYPLYRQAMSAAENALAAVGVEVLNSSPGSAINSFPRVRLEDAL